MAGREAEAAGRSAVGMSVFDLAVGQGLLELVYTLFRDFVSVKSKVRR